MSDALIESLTAAVGARPDDLPLRQHLAELLVAAGRSAEAIGHAAHILARHPGDEAARRVMAAALGPSPAATDRGPAAVAQVPPAPEGVDWDALESEFRGVVPPRFVTAGDATRPVGGDAERPAVTLADVGGMQQVKERLELSFLGPLRNPRLRGLYGKSLRGGLLL
ncbi:tetratricopeptide repeat protein [Actinoplanes sp. NPDC049548]|uniref:tetratricopeptide repeat protein n=1 Tax=Actinoplanes sp. NPDC049548 TaxID=3155152 RepID=UPI0034293AFF